MSIEAGDGGSRGDGKTMPRMCDLLTNRAFLISLCENSSTGFPAHQGKFTFFQSGKSQRI